jgi:hypothetical protein
MPLIHTEAYISAPPEAVFAVLTDFARYPEWNALNLVAEGECRLGARVKTRAFSPLDPARPVSLSLVITRLEPPHLLCWVGEVPLFFRGEHGFALSAKGAGTQLTHTENIGGLMAAFVGSRRILREFTPYYEQFNASLAARVASLS